MELLFSALYFCTHTLPVRYIDPSTEIQSESRRPRIQKAQSYQSQLIVSVQGRLDSFRPFSWASLFLVCKAVYETGAKHAFGSTHALHIISQIELNGLLFLLDHYHVAAWL